MEVLLAKLRRKQQELKDAAFDRPPGDFAGWMKVWAEWYGVGNAIAFIEEEQRDVEDRERDEK